MQKLTYIKINWDASFSTDIFRPSDEEIVAVLPYGYPDIEAKMPHRKELTEIIRYL